jgi:hypothetical protein
MYDFASSMDTTSEYVINEIAAEISKDVIDEITAEASDAYVEILTSQVEKRAPFPFYIAN